MINAQLMDAIEFVEPLEGGWDYLWQIRKT